MAGLARLLAIWWGLGLLLAPSLASADEGWVIRRFDAQIAIQSNGDLAIAETIDADFGNAERHGIFRDIPIVYDYDQKSNRVYDLDVVSVTDGRGGAIPYEVSREGSFLRIRIGDPNRTVSGPQMYRIAYRVQGALNGFPDHDELYWNVNGAWPVRTERTSATVTLPRDGIERTACYEGAAGSTAACRVEASARTATFTATGTLGENEQLTIVVAMPKGVVPPPQPKLVAKPRPLSAYFLVTPATVAAAAIATVAVAATLGWGWWTYGRDRRYTTIYYLTDDPSEETRPLFSKDPIVVEYEPPKHMRPAEIGVLLDERADTLDVTATIVDLAVRGYLTIAEIKPDGVLATLVGQKDWQLTRTEQSADDLLPFEAIVLDGLFASGSVVRVSALKNKFYVHLAKAKTALYARTGEQRWFARRPDQARHMWQALGIGTLLAGSALTAGLGYLFGAAIVAIPIALGGLTLVGMASWMPKRTARGRELLRRTLGFRQYVATAEQRRQEFNEQQNIFAAYLPFAIVFRCVDKWARAFRDVDLEAATHTWYTGSSSFAAADFSRSLQGFSSDFGAVAASTPGGSGGSGFSGGSAGGGGGGGGGGSW